MTKTFTVNIGGQDMKFDGPDDGTQEDAQKYAEAEWAKRQQEDVKRDFSGETGGPPGSWGNAIGRKVANFAQGGAELVGGPMQLLGGEPGRNYQTAENAPHNFGDSLARFAGAALPLGPLGAAKTLSPRTYTTRGPWGMLLERTINPATGAKLAPVAVGATEGASAPAENRTQRAINTGIGAFTGPMGRFAPTMGGTSLERLAGAALGMLGGRALGGPESWLSTYLGGRIGERAGPAIHQELSAILSKFPPSVIARALSSLGGSYTKVMSDQYNKATQGDNLP